MTKSHSRSRARWSVSLPLLVGCALAAPSALHAQELAAIDWARTPVLPPELSPGFLLAPAVPSMPVARPQRVRLLGFQPGFLSDPLGMDQDDPAEAVLAPKEFDPDPDWITISHGNDNPNFEFRLPRDPGGVGFYRVNTQLQLFDSEKTACSLGFQAFAPAGLQWDGLPDHQGSTVVTPAFSLFHALDDGLAIQGFVNKNVLVQPGGTAPIRTDLRSGMAIQRSLMPNSPDDALRNFYLSVGALGQYRMDQPSGPPVALEVLPGFSWKMADNWWVSGAVSVPVNATTDRGSASRWHLTCSFQF